ncbi:MAG: hypothetical protein V4721_10440 [Bacteroidota bacterium]
MTQINYTQLILDALPGESLQEKYEHLITLKKRKAPRGPAPKKIFFHESEIYDKEKFKQTFPDWPLAKLKHYYDSADTYSGEGNKYVNWDRTIHNWASRDDAQSKYKWAPDNVVADKLNGLVM